MRPTEPTHAHQRHTWNGSPVHVLPSAAYHPARDAARFAAGRIDHHPLFETPIDFDAIDLVHVRNDLSMGLAALYLRDRYHLPFVHQISHLKSDALIERTRRGFDGRLSWVKGQLGRRLRRFVANEADLVLPISEAMRTYLEADGYTAPMRTLPTGAEVVDTPPNGEPFRQRYGIDSDHILLYMGSMSPYRNLEFLFDVVEEVAEGYDVQLVMAGGRTAAHRERLEEEVADRALERLVTFTGWIDDRTTIHRAIAAADVGLSPLPTDSMLRTNAPIKILEYLSLATPVVASATPDPTAVLDASGGGYAVDYRVDAFTEAITDLLAAPERRRTMGRDGRRWLAKHRNFAVLTDRVEGYYRDLVPEEPVAVIEGA